MNKKRARVATSTRPTADAEAKAAQIRAIKQAERESRVEFVELPDVLTPDHFAWWAGSRRAAPRAQGILPTVFGSSATVPTSGHGSRLATCFD